MAGWGKYGAPYKTNLRGALPIEKAVDDTHKEVLWSGLCLQATPVAKDVWEYGPGIAAFEQKLLNMTPTMSEAGIDKTTALISNVWSEFLSGIDAFPTLTPTLMTHLEYSTSLQ